MSGLTTQWCTLGNLGILLNMAWAFLSQFLNGHLYVHAGDRTDQSLPTLEMELSLRRPNTSFSAKRHGESSQHEALRLSCPAPQPLCHPPPLPLMSLSRGVTATGLARSSPSPCHCNSAHWRCHDRTQDTAVPPQSCSCCRSNHHR